MDKYYFRGKSVRYKFWAHGFLFDYHGTCIGVDPLQANDYSEIYDSCYEEVIPESVGMWSQRLDKKGDRIFEGDLVVSPLVTGIVALHHSPTLGTKPNKVVLKDGVFCLEYEGHGLVAISSFNDEDLEVVGNSFDTILEE